MGGSNLSSSDRSCTYLNQAKSQYQVVIAPSSEPQRDQHEHMQQDMHSTCEHLVSKLEHLEILFVNKRLTYQVNILDKADPWKSSEQQVIKQQPQSTKTDLTDENFKTNHY